MSLSAPRGRRLTRLKNPPLMAIRAASLRASWLRLLRPFIPLARFSGRRSTGTRRGSSWTLLIRTWRLLMRATLRLSTNPCRCSAASIEFWLLLVGRLRLVRAVSLGRSSTRRQGRPRVRRSPSAFSRNQPWSWRGCSPSLERCCSCSRLVSALMASWPSSLRTRAGALRSSTTRLPLMPLSWARTA